MIVHRAWNGEDPWPWVTEAIRSTHRGHAITHHRLPTDDPRTARRLSNVLRVKLLHDLGGLWLDHDVVPLRCLADVSPEPWLAGLGRSPEGCAMWFPEPGHPFLAHCQGSLQVDPDELLANVLARALKAHPVRLEPRVLPFDAVGHRTPTFDVWAVHLWGTSSLTARR